MFCAKSQPSRRMVECGWEAERQNASFIDRGISGQDRQQDKNSLGRKMDGTASCRILRFEALASSGRSPFPLIAEQIGQISRPRPIV